MTVTATFFEHENFGGSASSFSTGTARYRGVHLGGLANEVTAMRATAAGGKDGNVYGFTNQNFDGRFASLNMAEGWTCWYSNVGLAILWSRVSSFLRTIRAGYSCASSRIWWSKWTWERTRKSSAFRFCRAI